MADDSPATSGMEDTVDTSKEPEVEDTVDTSKEPEVEDTVDISKELEVEDTVDTRKEPGMEDTVHTSNEHGNLAAQIIPHILNLYNCTATASDFDIYAPNATFEDPLMRAHGVAQIKSAFYALAKVFLDGTVVEYTIEEDKTSPTSGEIFIDNLQQYKLIQLGPLGYYATMQSLIKLKVEGGKVVRHEDLWGGYALWNRHTVRVPLVGRFAETMRRGSLLVTHVLMGFGKDHKTLEKDTSLHLKVA